MNTNKQILCVVHFLSTYVDIYEQALKTKRALELLREGNTRDRIKDIKAIEDQVRTLSLPKEFEKECKIVMNIIDEVKNIDKFFGKINDTYCAIPSIPSPDYNIEDISVNVIYSDRLDKLNEDVSACVFKLEDCASFVSELPDMFRKLAPQFTSLAKQAM